MNRELKKFKGFKPSNKSIFSAEVGDYVGNNHGTFGKITELDHRRCRATLERETETDFQNKEGWYEYSITGDNAFDTLCINGFSIYEKEFDG